jgi:hypothetical protein
MAEDLAGDEALETADDLHFAFAIWFAFFDVIESRDGCSSCMPGTAAALLRGDCDGAADGFATAAGYSDAHKDCRNVELADKAVRIET